jgi:hypothetical protein
MAARLNIRNEVADRAATRLSEMTGQTKTAVVIIALRKALELLEPPSARRDLASPDGAMAGTAAG